MSLDYQDVEFGKTKFKEKSGMDCILNHAKIRTKPFYRQFNSDFMLANFNCKTIVSQNLGLWSLKIPLRALKWLWIYFRLSWIWWQFRLTPHLQSWSIETDWAQSVHTLVALPLADPFLPGHLFLPQPTFRDIIIKIPNRQRSIAAACPSHALHLSVGRKNENVSKKIQQF
jgi:hypothetical protein